MENDEIQNEIEDEFGPDQGSKKRVNYKHFRIRKPSDAEKVLNYQINRCLADEDSVHLSSQISSLIGTWAKIRQLGDATERLEKMESRMVEVERQQKQRGGAQ